MPIVNATGGESSSSALVADPPSAVIPLRDPRERVSPKALRYWRVSALIGCLFSLGLLALFYFVVFPAISSNVELPGVVRSSVVWVTGTLAALSLLRAIFGPTIRYRVYRWELTDEALFTRSGWLSRQLRVAPLSRIQTVDSSQSALMRWFGVTTVEAANASSAGSILVQCLDDQVAKDLVAKLTEITAADPGDGA